MKPRWIVAWCCALWGIAPVVSVAALPDDEPTIQAALDAAYMAGGGTVTLPAGIHYIQNPLIIRSNVRLKGAGMGSTIIRSPAPGFGGKVVDGAEVYAGIAMVGADQAGVSDLTLDLFTNRTWTNGIVLLPTGAAWIGTPTMRSFVERVHIKGGGNYHAYMIWNLRGEHNKILNNIVDGGVPTYTTSVQEGIEIFGGVDIQISGNTVRNVGRACVTIGSALGGLAESDVVGLNVVNNNFEACVVGIYMSPVLNGQRSEDLSQIHIHNNLLRRIWLVGIFGSTVNGGRMDFVEIAGNNITGVGQPGQDGRGIWIEGLGDSASSILSIRGNVIADVTGFWGMGLYIDRYPGVSMSDNHIIRTGHSGIAVSDAEDADIRANHIVQATQHAMWISRAARAVVRDNTIQKWDTPGGGSPGILLQSSQWGVVTGNVFSRTAVQGAPEPYPVLVDSASQAVVTQNLLLYPSGLPGGGLLSPVVSKGAPEAADGRQSTGGRTPDTP